MDEFSERRLVENEQMFRHANQKRKNREQRTSSADNNGLILDFYCECSGRACHDPIRLDAKEYEKIHQNDRQFIALPGHEDKSIEEVIKQSGIYNIVQKFLDPAKMSRS